MALRRAALPEPFDVVVTRPVHRDCTVYFENRQYGDRRDAFELREGLRRGI